MRIQVQVFRDERALQDNKRLLERMIEVDDNINVDYNCVIRALSFLYGSDAIINFNIKTL